MTLCTVYCFKLGLEKFYVFVFSQIQVGGMIFDEKLCKGVRKQYIPPTQTMTFPASASYGLVIEKGREVFFPDEANDDDSFALADSNGVPYEVKDKTGWVLSEFVEGLKLPPSKLRIYILYWPPEPRVS